MSPCPRCGLAVTGRLALCPRCLLADDDAAAPVAPPGIELGEEIGRGGMGRVFRALHVRLGRPVAVKFLPAELAALPGFEARFEREARALARLSHPGIVGVHDFGTTEDGQSYLVMELLGGGTLAERLPLSPDRAIGVAVELCEALAHAHEKGLVHRDVKPENVLFDEAGRLKLGDFGIARLIDPEEGAAPVTRASLVLGTPAYMAPEARLGAPPDPRMDVYAVGVLLRRMVQAGPGVAPHAWSPALEALIARATEADPARRIASAAELRQELLRYKPAERVSRATVAHAGPASGPAASLPPEETSWLRAVALILAGATAVALYAFLVSFTPRTLAPDATLPLITFGVERLPDGSVLSRARFETWPTLGAAAAFALALAAYGLLRRHWRAMGLDRPTPDRPLTQSSSVLRLGALLVGLFGLRIAIAPTPLRPLATYVPIVGGLLELVMLYWLWQAVLEAKRTSRLLRREVRLWLGLGLSLLPPGISFLRMLAGDPP